MACCRVVLIVFIGLFSTLANALDIEETSILSPLRKKEEKSEEVARKRLALWKRYNDTKGVSRIAQSSPQSNATSYDELNAASVTSWQSDMTLQAAFTELRDERFITTLSMVDFPRRLSWLFPDDGCYVRASIANHKMKLKGLPVPNTLFIFGDLHVNTTNHPEGLVTWWYHVAPAVRINGEIYILDPSIKPSQPILLKEWALTQVSDLSQARFSICSPYTLNPFDYCEDKIDDRTDFADIDSFLKSEWYRQVELGRIPEDVLGNSPPWL